jgi:AcrR family transcriptional regulator
MSPQSKAQLSRARALKREQLIAAALVCLARHGYAGSTTKRLAQTAEVSEGLFYHYFPSKKALLGVIRDRVMKDIRARVRDSRASAARGAHTEAVVRAVLGQFRTHQDFWRLALFERANADVRAALDAEMRKLAGEVQAAIEEALRKDGAGMPKIEAELLFATIEGVSERFIRDPDNYPLDAVVDQFVLSLRAKASKG